MPLTLEQYATYLDTRNLPWPAPPDVKAPKAKPHLVQIPKVRAVTWSVYGTLLGISEGELLFEHPKPFIMNMALEKTIQEFNMWASMPRKAGQPSDYLKQIYTELLQQQVNVPDAPQYKEICSERVWEAVVKILLQKEYKFDPSFFGSLNEFSCKIAYFFHASLQGSAVYPGAVKVLRLLTAKKITQGLLADGQLFTPLQLQRSLKQQDATADLDALIDPEMRTLSHKVGVRKPSETLFENALDALKERGFAPGQVLHVGSRIANDVVPARRLGMRTALFAGDAASLQATAEQLKDSSSRPDVLLTELEQVLEVVTGRDY